MSSYEFVDSIEWARAADHADPLFSLRSEFLIPPGPDGSPSLYFAGHSLGLQPKKAREYVNAELDDWAMHGVEGHFEARHPWMPYHELVTAPMARLLGAEPGEVVVANTLTVNLHLLMVSFYRPTRERFRILIEGGAFPSDRYAVDSQARFHGFDPKDAVVELRPREGESTLRDEDVLETIGRLGSSLALVLVGLPNYLTGQAYDAPEIVRAGHAVGAKVGFDLAHAAGNLRLRLHDWGPDFAAWCNYKYLNAGPGHLGGMFVHARHANADLPRFAGWWGHDKSTRFRMGPEFAPIPGAEGWQLSNPPILPLACLRASLELFDRAGMPALRGRGDRLTAYLAWLLERMPPGRFELVTPKEAHRRGSMLTVRVPGGAESLVQFLRDRGANVDLRRPDIVRMAPTPIYGSYADVQRLSGLVRAWCESA